MDTINRCSLKKQSDNNSGHREKEREYFYMNKELVSPYDKQRLTIEIPCELHKQLKAFAQHQHISMNSLILKTLVKMIVNECYIKGKYPHFT